MGKVLILRKIGSYEKFDGYMPNKPHFVNDEICVSGYVSSFHTPITYGITSKDGGLIFGVNKKISKVSGYGAFVDLENIGKSDL